MFPVVLMLNPIFADNNLRFSFFITWWESTKLSWNRKTPVRLFALC